MLKKIRYTALILTFGFFCGVVGWRLGHADIKWQLSNNRPVISITNKEVPLEAKNLDFTLFWDVWSRLQQKYVDKSKIDTQKMFYGAIEGLTASIGDPYTVFLPPKENSDFKSDMAGSFEGIGAQLGIKDKRIIVIAPLSGYPAEKAGVKAGDFILKVNNEDTINWSVQEAVNKIRGPVGTKVTLNLFRDTNGKPFDITINREKIIVKSLETEYKTINNKKIAVMRLSRFGDDTEQVWKQQVDEILNNKANGIVLDLRNNPGGYLDGAVFVASEFLKDGLIVTQENYVGQRQEMNVNRKGKLLDIPVVVLINKGSASASEIVAGALRDRKRAKILGEQSFGKGSVQESEELTGGSALHVTIAKWLLPGGSWINGTGIKPDIEIAQDNKQPDKDLQLEKALILL